MKRLVGIIIFMIFLVTICISEELMVSNSVSKVKENCEQLLTLYAEQKNVNTEEIILLTSSTVDFWKEREHNLCFFINYKDMSEMSNELVKMLSYAKENIKEEYNTSLMLVLYYCETFDHITGFNFQNIF